MKKLLLLSTLCLFLGCSKTTPTPGIVYPKTNLLGSKWRTFISDYAFGGSMYEYLTINSSGTSAIVTFADANGANGSSVTGTCVITYDTSGRNIDSFTVTYSSGKTSSGFTTSNVDQIDFDGKTYDRLN